MTALLIRIIVALIVAIVVYVVGTAFVHFSHDHLVWGLIAVILLLVIIAGSRLRTRGSGW